MAQFHQDEEFYYLHCNTVLCGLSLRIVAMCTVIQIHDQNIKIWLVHECVWWYMCRKLPDHFIWYPPLAV